MEADAGGSCIERAGVGPDHSLPEVRASAAVRRAGSARRTRPSTSRKARALLRSSLPSRSSICSRVGGSPIHRSPSPAGRNASRNLRSTSLIARQPSTSPGAKLRISASHRSSSSQSCTLEPSRNGTNSPLTAGVHSKAALGQISTRRRPGDAAVRPDTRMATCARREKVPRSCRRRRLACGSRAPARACPRAPGTPRTPGRCAPRRQSPHPSAAPPIRGWERADPISPRTAAVGEFTADSIYRGAPGWEADINLLIGAVRPWPAGSRQRAPLLRAALLRIPASRV